MNVVKLMMHFVELNSLSSYCVLENDFWEHLCQKGNELMLDIFKGNLLKLDYSWMKQLFYSN